MRRLLCCLSLLFLTTAALGAPVKFSGSARVRAENWSWFDTPGSDDQYLFFGALLRVSAAQQLNPDFDWQLEAAVPALVSLPDQAVAPAPRGQLGMGASYYAANRETNAASLFPKQAFVRYKTGAHTLRAGRFEFNDGTEVVPKNAMLAALKSGRVAQRLIGNFGFSHVGRSADGVQYAFNRNNLNLTGLVFRPTVGAFNVDGLGEVDDVSIAYGAATYSRANADERVFVIGYSDDRGLLKTDNRPAAARNADRESIDLVTIGGHYLAAFGKGDVLLWGAWQTGDWGVQDHNAYAIDIEGGYHFAGDRKMTLRGGVFRSSGDDDAADGDHETFFQVLPTPRIYARFPFYNAMNSTDVFALFSMKPHAKVTLSSEAHLLSLTEGNDLWYAGGGAFEDTSFGFAGRPGNGHDDLARVVDVGVDYALNPKTSFTVYGGVADGGKVVDTIFSGDTATFVYVEMTRRF